LRRRNIHVDLRGFAAKHSRSPRKKTRHYNDYENYQDSNHPGAAAATTIVCHFDFSFGFGPGFKASCAAPAVSAEMMAWSR